MSIQIHRNLFDFNFEITICEKYVYEIPAGANAVFYLDNTSMRLDGRGNPCDDYMEFIGISNSFSDPESLSPQGSGTAKVKNYLC